MYKETIKVGNKKDCDELCSILLRNGYKAMVSYIPSKVYDDNLADVWEVQYCHQDVDACPCEYGIDSKACVGCPNSDDGNRRMEKS